MKQQLEIKIDDEFKQLIPPLTNEEYTTLEELIVEEGCRDPLVLWDNIILDGHNRYKICNEHGLIFKTVQKNLDDRNAAKIWIIKNQFGKRNLTDGWKYELRLKKKELLDDIGRKKQAHGKTAPGKTLLTKNDKSVNHHNTRKEIAKELKWGETKVAEAEVVRKENPVIWEDVKTGDKTVHAAYKEVTGMSEKTRMVLFSSEHDDWSTPKERLKELDDEFHFDFDPCPFHSPFDGLKCSWKKRNFINPPYSNITDFLKKGHEELENGSDLCVYLIPVRTDTKWFHTYVYPYFKKEKKPYAEIRFVKGRIKFEDGTGSKCSAPFPSMIVVFRRK